MTNEEAIRELSERIKLGEKEYMKEIPEYIEALKIATKALEKQIPKMSEFKCPYLCKLNEKVSNMCDPKVCEYKAYLQGRADAIEQILEQMKAYRDAHYYSFANYDVQKYADGFKRATDNLISMVEMIKEQNDGSNYDKEFWGDKE